MKRCGIAGRFAPGVGLNLPRLPKFIENPSAADARALAYTSDPREPGTYQYQARLARARGGGRQGDMLDRISNIFGKIGPMAENLYSVHARLQTDKLNRRFELSRQRHLEQLQRLELLDRQHLRERGYRLDAPTYSGQPEAGGSMNMNLLLLGLIGVAAISVMGRR